MHRSGPESCPVTPSGALPDDELPVLATLHPTENLALAVARAQVGRGENPSINVTAVLVAALDRISGRSDWSLDD